MLCANYRRAGIFMSTFTTYARDFIVLMFEKRIILLLCPCFFLFLGVLTSVVAIFYLASWQLGAVEAVSLSILVGTSVDYCVHLVEGYILAGNAIPDLTTAKVSLDLFVISAVIQLVTVVLNCLGWGCWPWAGQPSATWSSFGSSNPPWS